MDWINWMVNINEEGLEIYLTFLSSLISLILAIGIPFYFEVYKPKKITQLNLKKIRRWYLKEFLKYNPKEHKMFLEKDLVSFRSKRYLFSDIKEKDFKVYKKKDLEFYKFLFNLNKWKFSNNDEDVLEFLMKNHYMERKGKYEERKSKYWGIQ